MVSEQETSRASASRNEPGGLTESVFRVVADVSAADLPLAEGLRAAAADAGPGRLSRTLTRISTQLDQGQELGAVLLTDSQLRLPPHIAGVLAAGVRTGQLEGVLVELMQRQHVSRSIRSAAVSALIYPLLLLVASAGIFVIAYGWMMPQLLEMVRQFDIQIPTSVQWQLAISEMCVGVINFLSMIATPVGAIITVALVAIASGVYFLLANFGGQRFSSTVWWMATTTPLMGVILEGLALAGFGRLVSVLFAAKVPAPDAVRIAASSVNNAAISLALMKVADGLEQGRKMGELIDQSRRLPSSVVPLVQAGEKTGKLDSAWLTISQMFEHRALARAQLILTLVPPILFVLIGGLALGVVSAIAMPLMRMISALS